MEKPNKFLIVRNDRIGDLVLTLPALEILRRSFPEAEISLLCSEYASPIVRGNPNIDRLLTGKPAHDESDFEDTLEEIREIGADAAVTMVHSWKNLKLLKESGVPLRIGPWVKLTAPLYLNKPVRQNRSSAAKHEAQYNVDLLRPLGIDQLIAPPAVLDVGSDLRIWAEDHLDVEFSAVQPQAGGGGTSRYGRKRAQLAGTSLGRTYPHGCRIRIFSGSSFRAAPEKMLFSTAYRPVFPISCLFENFWARVFPR